VLEKIRSTPSAAERGESIDWRKTYSRRLVLTDLAVLIWVVIGVQIAWFPGVGLGNSVGVDLKNSPLSYTVLSVVIIASWMLLLSMFDTRSARVLGTGAQEYRLIADSAVRLFGLVAIVAFLFQLDLARGYILISFPLGILTLLVSRWLWRQWLGAQRLTGRYSSRVLLVGSEESALHVARQLASQPAAGYLVVGACVPTGRVGGYLDGESIPVFGSIERVLEAMAATGADTVMVTSGDLAPERVRELSWSLEPGRQHLVVAPSLTDIGGPRIHTRPVAGLPLIHVETPRYEGRRLFAKRIFDVAASGVLLLALSPLLAVVAITVRLSTPGPVLFRQQRVGINGTHFNMLKFRSMVIDAEARLAALQAEERAEGNTVMFKMKNDPRITPIGGFMRRFSIDELPQLFNVFGGSMSLVGPRPPLEREVAEYETHVHRRFLVKPGITGLWQVSGRSNLSWSDTVRLDLYYVENWSAMGDLVILWRTARAVFASEGAY
jgi:exopolysaccharide biosynthesis polyprenyl glycosylphosphotransferase